MPDLKTLRAEYLAMPCQLLNEYPCDIKTLRGDRSPERHVDARFVGKKADGSWIKTSLREKNMRFKRPRAALDCLACKMVAVDAMFVCSKHHLYCAKCVPSECETCDQMVRTPVVARPMRNALENEVVECDFGPWAALAQKSDMDYALEMLSKVTDDMKQMPYWSTHPLVKMLPEVKTLLESGKLTRDFLAEVELQLESVKRTMRPYDDKRKSMFGFFSWLSSESSFKCTGYHVASPVMLPALPAEPCEWKGPLKDLAAHLKSCSRVPLVCSEEGCNGPADHECELKMMPCEACDLPVRRKDLKAHLDMCALVEIECKCSQKRPRVSPTHMCPEELVVCVCSQKVLRKDLESHIAETLQAHQVKQLAARAQSMIPAKHLMLEHKDNKIRIHTRWCQLLAGLSINLDVLPVFIEGKVDRGEWFINVRAYRLQSDCVRFKVEDHEPTEWMSCNRWHHLPRWMVEHGQENTTSVELCIDLSREK